MSQELAQTPLHGWHVSHDARMADFAGWAMPIQYTSIKSEHLQTRSSVAIFDVSHMARFRFEGLDVARFLDSIVTRNVADLPIGGIRYSLMTNEAGNTLDDVLIYHVEGVLGETYFAMVANAGNRKKLVRYIESHAREKRVTFIDETANSAMYAVQGPNAAGVLKKVCDGFQLDSLKYYASQVVTISGTRVLLSRTGYTGEDGFEISFAAERANAIWELLYHAGEEYEICAAGLGARDTLRLEAGMPLYGHELSEDLSPTQARLGFAINMEKQFVGRDAIEIAMQDKSLSRLIGLKLDGKRVPREAYPVVTDNTNQIGTVSSGTFSPTLEFPIAMAFVRPEFTSLGTELSVDIRGRLESAKVVKLPFYRREKG